MNYHKELIRQKYWNIYLSLMTEHLCKILNISNKYEYKIKHKLLAYNTYIIGFSNKFNNIMVPPDKIIKKYSNELFLDIKHNYDVSSDLFEKIIEHMIILNKKINNLATDKMKQIDNDNIVVKYKKSGDDIHLQLGDDVYKLSENNYKRLVKKYTNKNISVDYAICNLLLRYTYYGEEKQGICLSANSIYEWVKLNNYQTDALELFAGSLNSNLPNYCSLFPDIEKYFGSKGSMFLYKKIYKYDLLISNPPYLTNVMTSSANIIIKYLSETKKGFAIVNVPDWRSNLQYKFDNANLINKHIKIGVLEQKRQDSEYENYQILSSSPYFRKTIMIGNYKYKNFFDNNFASIRDNILIIVLSSVPDDSRINSFIDYIIKN